MVLSDAKAGMYKKIKEFTSFNFYYNSKSDVLDVILHGGSHGIDSPLMRKVFAASKEKEHSVLTFNFPYFERGEENSSGNELIEELGTLQKMLDQAKYKDYLKVRLIAKSLGGIVASFYLDKLSKEESERFSVVILGYVTGDVRLKNFEGEITIIQGEKDKFGGIDVVKKDLAGAKSTKIKLSEVKGADHSYRNPDTKEPIYEDDAVELVKSVN